MDMDLHKEFPAYEYEMKFSLGYEEIRPEQYVSAVRELVREIFIPADEPLLTKRYGHFFFDHPNEPIVLLEDRASSPHTYYRKTKGAAERLDTHLPYDKWITKRTERVTPISLDKAFKEAAQQQYLGLVEKDNCATHIVHKETGRVFSLEAAVSKHPDSGRVRRQLEIEYLGVRPQEGTLKGDEKQLAYNLLQCGQLVAQGYSGLRCEDGIFKVLLTRETKRDIIDGQVYRDEIDETRAFAQFSEAPAAYEASRRYLSSR